MFDFSIVTNWIHELLLSVMPEGSLRHNGEQQLMYPVCYYTKVEHIFFNY